MLCALISFSVLIVQISCDDVVLNTCGRECDGPYFGRSQQYPNGTLTKALTRGSDELFPAGRNVWGSPYAGNGLFRDGTDFGLAAVHQGLLRVGEYGTLVSVCMGCSTSFVGFTSTTLPGHKTLDTSSNFQSFILTRWSGCGQNVTAVPPGSSWPYQVVGSTSGSVVGSNFTYTEDSDMYVAATHAGLVSVGGFALIVVTCGAMMTDFLGSNENGITSQSLSGGPYRSVTISKSPPVEQTLQIGICSFRRAPEATLSRIGKAIAETMEAAVNGVNAVGGIHGRRIEMCEVEITADSSTFEYKVYECALGFNNTVMYPNMLSVMGGITDDMLKTFSSSKSFQAMNLMQISPFFSGKYKFTEDYIVTRADSRMQLIAMLNKAVHELHAKRIALAWSGDIGLADEKVGQAREILKHLGLDLCGWFAVPFFAEKYRWDLVAYNAFFDSRPQVILLFTTPTANSGQFLLELIMSSVNGRQVDQNLVIMTWGVMSVIFSDVISYLKLLRVPFKPEGRFFVTMDNPSLSDSRYQASQHAMRDMAEFYGNENFLRNGTGFLYTSMSIWVALQTFFATLRDVHPNNTTRAAIKSKSFDTASFAVDDLLIGMFSGPCTGIRLELGLQCECNVGFGIVEMYSLNNSYFPLPVPGGRAVAPAGDCGGSSAATIPQPLIYLVAFPATPSSNVAITEKMLAGLRGFENISRSKTIAKLEFISSSDAASLANLVTTIDTDRLLTAMFPSIVESNANVSVPVIDPFSVPAAPAPAFIQNILFLSATLQQELYVLSEVAAVLNWRGGVSCRGQECPEIANVVKKSLNSFALSLVGPTSIVGANDTLQLACGDCATIVLGLSSISDVANIAQFLKSNPKALVIFAFAELCAYYDILVATLIGVDDRVYFASSLRNWNAKDMPTNLQSTLMVSYFEQFNASTRSPLTLRGFFAAAAVQQVISQITGAVTQATILRAWYEISVVAVSTTDFIGPFSRNVCHATTDTVCETNVGARQMYVMTLADATWNATAATSYVFATVFATGRIDYRALPTGFQPLSVGVIAGIAAGSLVGLVVFISFVVWSRSGTRDNTYAPKDSSVPLTVIFTDIQSSTALWANAPDVMGPALEVHHALIRELIKKFKCYEVKTVGDCFMIACKEAGTAVALSVELQHVFFNYNWNDNGEIDKAYHDFEREKATETKTEPPTADLPPDVYRLSWNGIRVRIGIHTGLGDIKHDAITKGYDYYGPVSNIAARTESSGHGGQVVVTKFTLEALLPEEVKRYTIIPLGPTVLRGVTDPVELFQVSNVPGRIFHEIEAQTTHDRVLECGGTDPSSEEDRSVYHVAPNTQWQKACVHHTSLMFSRCSPELRKKCLGEMCKGWDLTPQGAHTPGLRDDPYVGAMSKLMSSIMLKKFGHLVQEDSLFSAFP